MATALPTPTTTAVPLPDYQVAGAAADPRSGSGSVGPFIGVLVAVLVLTALSCFVGRVCAAQAEGPDERYDCMKLAAGHRRCWWWLVSRRPAAKPAEEAKLPAAPQVPEP